jgi:hypothetical protein
VGRPKKQLTLDDFPYKPSFTVDEYIQITGAKRTSTYAAIHAGRIRTLYPGSWMIPRSEVEQALGMRKEA